MVLADQTAIVTGGGRGIGRAIAEALAAEGAAVLVAARTGVEIEETVARITAAGGTAAECRCDVTEPAEVDAMVRRALTTFGGVDILVNNAGTARAIGAVSEVDPQDWWADLTTNLFGPYLCARAVLPPMLAQQSGCIINVYGGGTGAPYPWASAYGCSKAAVARFTDSLAAEVAEYGVRVNALSPGSVRTRINDYIDDPRLRNPYVERIRRLRDRGGFIGPEQAARIAVFLASAAAAGLTGRLIGVEHDLDALRASIPAIMAVDGCQLRLIGPEGARPPSR